MGAYSEIDLERQISDNPFEESGNIPECAGTEPGAAEPQPQEETSHVSPESAPQTNPSADDTANKDEKKKAHEEAEAKRKADFDARQAAKKAAEQEQLDRLAGQPRRELKSRLERQYRELEHMYRTNYAVKRYHQEHPLTSAYHNPEGVSSYDEK